jgi:hypothetical protein
MGGGVVEVQLHAFLTSALYVGEWLDSRSGLFTPGNNPASSRQKAAWATEADWTLWKREKLCLLGIETRPQGIQITLQAAEACSTTHTLYQLIFLS